VLVLISFDASVDNAGAGRVQGRETDRREGREDAGDQEAAIAHEHRLILLPFPTCSAVLPAFSPTTLDSRLPSVVRSSLRPGVRLTHAALLLQRLTDFFLPPRSPFPYFPCYSRSQSASEERANLALGGSARHARQRGGIQVP
jgi:hypothetical protein